MLVKLLSKGNKQILVVNPVKNPQKPPLNKGLPPIPTGNPKTHSIQHGLGLLSGIIPPLISISATEGTVRVPYYSVL